MIIQMMVQIQLSAHQQQVTNSILEIDSCFNEQRDFLLTRKVYFVRSIPKFSVKCLNTLASIRSFFSIQIYANSCVKYLVIKLAKTDNKIYTQTCI